MHDHNYFPTLIYFKRSNYYAKIQVQCLSRLNYAILKAVVLELDSVHESSVFVLCFLCFKYQVMAGYGRDYLFLTEEHLPQKFRYVISHSEYFRAYFHTGFLTNS